MASPSRRAVLCSGAVLTAVREVHVPGAISTAEPRQRSHLRALVPHLVEAVVIAAFRPSGIGDAVLRGRTAAPIFDRGKVLGRPDTGFGLTTPATAPVAPNGVLRGFDPSCSRAADVAPAPQSRLGLTPVRRYTLRRRAIRGGPTRKWRNR